MVIDFLSIMHQRIKLNQMRIGVDLDGVVADFTKGWTTQYSLDFGKVIDKDEHLKIGLNLLSCQKFRFLELGYGYKWLFNI